MEITIVLAHPSPGSFNHAIAETAAAALRENGHSVHLHDLCAERFDPILPGPEFAKDGVAPPGIEEYCQEIVKADGIIVVHPNWWAQPPAILKGWLDRVLRQNVAYKFGPRGVEGLLRAKAAIVFNTANTPLEDELRLYGDPLDRLWKNCIFKFCGIKTVCRRLYTSVVMSSLEQREKWLKDVTETVRRYFPR
jgi:putative NADPH-quinone reductase